MLKDEWKKGISEEVKFWTEWIETKGGEYADDYSRRVNTDQPLQEYFTKHLLDFNSPVLKILDVGAGPMTVVGKKWDRAQVDITAVDALATVYESLPYPTGLPLIKTTECDSELLSSKFKPNSFDIAHASNTLDHGYDPVKAILEMVKVVKPNGILILEHHANEAANAEYGGFHQWNFNVVNSDITISNRTDTFKISEVIKGVASIIDISPDGADWVYFVLRKNA